MRASTDVKIPEGEAAFARRVFLPLAIYVHAYYVYSKVEQVRISKLEKKKKKKNSFAQILDHFFPERLRTISLSTELNEIISKRARVCRSF